ncbi:MAG TPA: aspartate kinase [Candidatus Thermoplasmatota archaeon]|nr:aspartate kinase [Candidatus Thermoplasmatota archaeon]
MGSGEMLRRVSSIVKAHPGERVVVASAMAGVTDSILAALPRVQRDEGAIAPFLEELRSRHMQAAEEALRSPALVDEVYGEIDALLQKFERLLYGIAYTSDLTPKSKDLALSFGERLSVRVLSAAMRDQGVDAAFRDAEHVGLVTDGTFGNASPLMGEIQKNFDATLRPLLKGGVVPVLTGYFGVSPDGHATTFGRGGSDYAASIVATALDAEALEVWKDVDGFLTADPRILKDARPIREMSYDEAAELAYVGAKVLHPRTVEPVKTKGIPIFVRNTMKPEVEGTRIGPPTEARAAKLRSVATRDGLAILRIYGPGMAYTPGIGQKVFTALGQAKVNVYNMAASQASFALLINEEDITKGLKALEQVREGIIEYVEGLKDMTLVCVVGDIGRVEGTAGRIFSAIGHGKVNIEMISVGASEIALNFVIRSKDKEACIRALHNEFDVE